MADRLSLILNDVHRETSSAIAEEEPINSAHGGYALILEELVELWAEVKKPKEKRSKSAMSKKSVRIAAIAVRFVYDLRIGNFTPHDKPDFPG